MLTRPKAKPRFSVTKTTNAQERELGTIVIQKPRAVIPLDRLRARATPDTKMMQKPHLKLDVHVWMWTSAIEVRTTVIQMHRAVIL